ncbi:MAG: hypothetical protein ACREN1_06600, partial [Candidatus Dormibacteria bacterium]
MRAEQAEKQRQIEVAKAGGREAFEAAAPARQETTAAGAWWLHPDAFKVFGISKWLSIGERSYLRGYAKHPQSHGAPSKSGHSLIISADGLE